MAEAYSTVPLTDPNRDSNRVEIGRLLALCYSFGNSEWVVRDFASLARERLASKHTCGPQFSVESLKYSSDE